jgi:NAD+ synthase
MHTRSKDIAAWLRERLTEAGARGFAVGMSGGLDSAVVARLCQMAAPDQTIAVMMPCHSSPEDEADARLVTDHFELPAVRLDLGLTYDRLTADMGAAMAVLPARHSQNSPADEAECRVRLSLANVKPRLRMTSLYYLANSLNYLVAGTGNRAEVTIGYFTKYGDGGVDVLPLGDLLKSEVRALARDLGVPGRVIDKAPSAGLWAGQTDEAEMGFTYAELERYLADGPEAVSPALALRIERLIRRSEHKRHAAPTPSSAARIAEI